MLIVVLTTEPIAMETCQCIKCSNGVFYFCCIVFCFDPSVPFPEIPCSLGCAHFAEIVWHARKLGVLGPQKLYLNRQSQCISKKNYRAHSPKNLAHHTILQNFSKASTALCYHDHLKFTFLASLMLSLASLSHQYQIFKFQNSTFWKNSI